MLGNAYDISPILEWYIGFFDVDQDFRTAAAAAKERRRVLLMLLDESAGSGKRISVLFMITMLRDPLTTVSTCGQYGGAFPTDRRK
jgi:hypothetical protein